MSEGEIIVWLIPALVAVIVSAIASVLNWALGRSAAILTEDITSWNAWLLAVATRVMGLLFCGIAISISSTYQTVAQRQTAVLVFFAIIFAGFVFDFLLSIRRLRVSL